MRFVQDNSSETLNVQQRDVTRPSVDRKQNVSWHLWLSLGSIGLSICTSILLASSAQAGANDFLSMESIARIRNFPTEQRLPIDILDREIYSPKSARFSADGSKLYINSLEGGITVVYSWPNLRKLRSISHRFNERNQELFRNESEAFNNPYFAQSQTGNPNHFLGKPVESELSHGGRWLWVPYYRRSFDSSAQSPSAVAIIDTQNDRIVRVMPTGPIPKYVAASPDGRYVAITHWGNNTIGLIDTSSGDPLQFTYVTELVVEQKLDQSELAGTDRDRTCGFCLRGTVFTEDSKYLFVARMGGGGVAGFDIEARKYLGTVTNIASTPRHLEISPDGATVFASSNVSGTVSKVSTELLLRSLLSANGRRIAGPRWSSIRLGRGARTIGLDPTGQVVFAAMNGDSELVAVETQSLREIARIAVDPYAVGLAIAPDGSAAVVTSQGAGGRGGNAVNIIMLRWGDAFYSRSGFVQNPTR